MGQVGGRAAGAPPPASAASRRYLIFGVTSIALLMSSIDQTIVATALATLQHALHAAINWSSWTITVYALGQIIAMPLAGALSDTYGRKKLFLGAVIVFTVSSLCCGLSANIYQLVTLRALQALGGGAFMPSATGIVTDQFGRDRDRAVGLFSTIFPIGAVVGPILGGVFVTYWSWRGIFLVNIPIGVTLLVAGTFVIPGSSVRSRRSFDLVGVAEMAVGMLGVMTGISLLGSGKSASFLLPLLAGLASLALFVARCGRVDNPVIPIRLLREKGFAVMNLINFSTGAAVLGFASLVPLYAEQRFALSALSAGTLLTARALGMIAISALAAFSLRRTGYRLPMMGGFLIAAAGTALLAYLPARVAPYAWLAAAAAVAGLGMGIFLPATNNATLQLVPESAASISGLRGMFRQAGGITGLAVASAVLARSSDPGHTGAWMFTILALVLVALIPLTFLVPEHHGTW